MHSRIFQFSSEPLTEDDYITEFDLDEWFVGTIADYAVESNSREYDLEWLASFIEPHGAVVDQEKGAVYFPKGFKTAYFKKRFKEFKKLADELTLEVFAGIESDGDFKIYLELLIEDKFGFYIYTEYLQTLDDFIRKLEEGSTYYIGTIIDYHA
mgnify:FL=1